MRKSISNVRVKGHNAEREFAKRFREIGFNFCKTSRQSSRLLDDCGIDLSGLPFNIQIKSGYKRNRPKADVLFTDMQALLKENFPSHEAIHQFPKILIHKLDSRKPENELVTMTWDDWIKFLNAYKEKNGL